MKKSKRIISMILAVIMLSMTAIGVNAHDELPAEKIDTTEIAVDSLETEATGDSELLEKVEPSVSEIDMHSNESETEVEAAEEEELQPQSASRSIAECAQAIGFSGASYSYIKYQSLMTYLTADSASAQKMYNIHAANFLSEINTMQDIFNDLSNKQKAIWLSAHVSSSICSLISTILGTPAGNYQEAIISELADALASIALGIGETLGNIESTSLANSFCSWVAAEERATNAFWDFYAS